MKYLCGQCKTLATWNYAPSGNHYCCETHVPRGCLCNIIDDSDVEPTDEKGRLYPCIEWDYSSNGFRVE